MSKFEQIFERVNAELEEAFTSPSPAPTTQPAPTTGAPTATTPTPPVSGTPTKPTVPPTNTYDSTHPAIQNIAKETDPNKILKMFQDLNIVLPPK